MHRLSKFYPVFVCFAAISDEVWAGLKLFGYESFRSGQERAVMRILCGTVYLATHKTSELFYFRYVACFKCSFFKFVNVRKNFEQWKKHRGTL